MHLKPWLGLLPSLLLNAEQMAMRSAEANVSISGPKADDARIPSKFMQIYRTSHYLRDFHLQTPMVYADTGLTDF